MCFTWQKGFMRDMGVWGWVIFWPLVQCLLVCSLVISLLWCLTTFYPAQGSVLIYACLNMIENFSWNLKHDNYEGHLFWPPHRTAHSAGLKCDKYLCPQVADFCSRIKQGGKVCSRVFWLFELWILSLYFLSNAVWQRCLIKMRNS